MQQRVEILKMLLPGRGSFSDLRRAHVELTPGDRRTHGIMKNLVREGKSIILITHKLREIQGGGCCTVIRRGKRIGR